MYHYFTICDKLKQNKKIDYEIVKRYGDVFLNLKFVNELISILSDLDIQVTKENKVTPYIDNATKIESLSDTYEVIILHIEII
jgi:hypothetical protein